MRALKQGPGFFPPGLVAAEHRLAVAVLVALEIDLHLVPGLQFGILAGGVEFLEGDPAGGLESDVDHRHVVLYEDHGAFEHGAFERPSIAKRFLEQFGKVLAGRKRLGHFSGVLIRHMFS